MIYMNIAPTEKITTKNRCVFQHVRDYNKLKQKNVFFFFCFKMVSVEAFWFHI